MIPRSIPLWPSGYFTRYGYRVQPGTDYKSERILVNGEKWIDITPFLDYFLEIVEKSMITSMKEEQHLSENEKISSY